MPTQYFVIMDLVDVNGKWKMGLNGKKEVNYTKVVVISLELIVLVKVTSSVFRAEFGFFHFEEHFLKSTCQVIIPGYVTCEFLIRKLHMRRGSHIWSVISCSSALFERVNTQNIYRSDKRMLIHSTRVQGHVLPEENACLRPISEWHAFELTLATILKC